MSQFLFTVTYGCCLKQILILIFLFICFAYIIFVVSYFGIRSYDMDAEYAYHCWKDDSILPKKNKSGLTLNLLPAFLLR